MQLAAIDRGDHRRRRAERLGEAGLERSELEEVEQLLDRRLIRANDEVGGQIHGSVSSQHADFEVLAHSRLRLAQ